ncbi:ribose 5-phosphate isomerase B [Hyphobacterium sp. CCMP332]|nr:ribose 5-phosphate isomerase B [Hyphobacterium sp. CCMP332]
MEIKLGIGSDHAGYEYKKAIKAMLEKKGYEIIDYGTHSEESVDYPDYIHPMASDVEKNKISYGIAICGSGNGVAMTANKHQDVRAALCWNPELAGLARQHNDANMICLPSRFINVEMAKSCVLSFLSADFEGGRHQRRVDKISC